jgi:hypothetical protein
VEFSLSQQQFGATWIDNSCSSRDEKGERDADRRWGERNDETGGPDRLKDRSPNVGKVSAQQAKWTSWLRLSNRSGQSKLVTLPDERQAILSKWE